jgi:Ca2+-binding RTX toxin-like protein
MNSFRPSVEALETRTNPAPTVVIEQGVVVFTGTATADELEVYVYENNDLRIECEVHETGSIWSPVTGTWVWNMGQYTQYARLKFVLGGGDDNTSFHFSGQGNQMATEQYGQDDNDVLRGAGNLNTLDGGAGNDRLHGGNNHDTMRGWSGDDVMFGGGGNDDMSGSTGNDFLAGEGGVDALLGGDDNDHLDGGTGGDMLSGGAGDDFLFADDGAVWDWVEGGTGTDECWADRTAMWNGDVVMTCETTHWTIL